ncbi:MAG: AgmX/PglI C-terminal domain-containing protein [Enhygromyxa sp.]
MRLPAAVFVVASCSLACGDSTPVVAEQTASPADRSTTPEQAEAPATIEEAAPTAPPPPPTGQDEAHPQSDVTGGEIGQASGVKTNKRDDDGGFGLLELGIDPPEAVCSPGEKLGGKNQPVPTVAFKVERDDESESRIIQRVVRARTNELRACYAKTLTADESATGWVDIELTLATTGKVAAVSVSGFDAKLEKCVKRTIHGLQFPPKIAGPVNLRLRFRPA